MCSKNRNTLQPQRRKADTSPQPISVRGTIPPPLPRLIKHLNVDLLARIEPIPGLISHEHLTLVVVFEEDGIGLLGGDVAAGCGVADLAPVRADDG